jgi:hypothetical protein
MTFPEFPDSGDESPVRKHVVFRTDYSPPEKPQHETNTRFGYFRTHSRRPRPGHIDPARTPPATNATNAPQACPPCPNPNPIAKAPRSHRPTAERPAQPAGRRPGPTGAHDHGRPRPPATHEGNAHQVTPAAYPLPGGRNLFGSACDRGTAKRSLRFRGHQNLAV